MSKARVHDGRFIAFATVRFFARAISIFLRILQSSSQRSKWVSITRRSVGLLKKTRLPKRETSCRSVSARTRVSYVNVSASRNREKPPPQSPAKMQSDHHAGVIDAWTEFNNSRPTRAARRRRVSGDGQDFTADSVAGPRQFADTNRRHWLRQYRWNDRRPVGQKRPFGIFFVASSRRTEGYDCEAGQSCQGGNGGGGHRVRRRTVHCGPVRSDPADRQRLLGEDEGKSDARRL